MKNDSWPRIFYLFALELFHKRILIPILRGARYLRTAFLFDRINGHSFIDLGNSGSYPIDANANWENEYERELEITGSKIE